MELAKSRVILHGRTLSPRQPLTVDEGGRGGGGGHLGDVLVQQPQGDDRQGCKQQVVERLQPVVVEALPRVGCVQVEPELDQREDRVLVEEVPAFTSLTIIMPHPL